MSPRELVAEALMVDRATVTPYQPGKHKPPLWQDGERIYAVSPKAPATGSWKLVNDQTRARSQGTAVWESVPESGEE